MERRAFVLGLAATSVLASGCALIVEGPKKPHERTHEILWGYVIIDVLFLGVLPLLIDFATGAIYKDAGYAAVPEGSTEERLLADARFEGRELTVCEAASAMARETRPGRLRAFSRDLRDHAAQCPTCSGALASAGGRRRVFEGDCAYLPA